MKNDELLHKWINGELNITEEAEFKRRPEYAALAKIYKNTADIAAPKVDEKTMLTQILAQPKAKIRQLNTKSNTRRRMLQIAVAAAVLLGAVFFLLPDSYENNYQTALAEQTEGTLPDGSTFVLNAESKLTYDKEKWATNRELQLEGEAFFEVKEGEKFTVNTANGNVQVLGTKFNVQARNQVLEVTCQSGKVGVFSINGEQKTTLEKGDAARLLRGNLIDEWTFTSTDKAAWMDGLFSLKKVPLAMVLQELERQFAIEIVADNIDTTIIVTANFENKNLETALVTALGQLGVQHRIEGKKVVLFK